VQDKKKISSLHSSDMADIEGQIDGLIVLKYQEN
jgi:hypothetical protein